MIYLVWMIPQLWTSITPGFFFQSLTAASCHSARRACPKLQNPLLQNSKGNLLHGEKGPVSGRMRDDEKGIFPEPYPASGIVPLSRRAQLILRMIDSATSPFGSAQNDKVGGKLQRLKIFGLKKPIKRERESGAVFIGYWLALCAFFFDWCMSLI